MTDAASPALQHIAVAGAGRWGTALALVAARAGRAVTLWARRPELAASIGRDRENAAYLPGVALPETIQVTADPAALGAAQAVLLALPAQALRTSGAALAGDIGSDRPLVICAKGIERESGRLLSEVLAESLPGHPVAALSGPNFAGEIARGLPAGTTVACPDPALGDALVAALGSARFRPYRSTDLTGVLLGGAMKNVIAIACGIVAGRRLGENARAGLITRGLAEIVRLGAALGARPETFMGLSGLGDLTLTCTTPQSRNYAFGLALGEGRGIAAALAGSAGVVEGHASAPALVAMAARAGVELPIATAVESILERGSDIDREIEALMARPFRAEGD